MVMVLAIFFTFVTGYLVGGLLPLPLAPSFDPDAWYRGNLPYLVDVHLEFHENFEGFNLSSEWLVPYLLNVPYEGIFHRESLGLSDYDIQYVNETDIDYWKSKLINPRITRWTDHYRVMGYLNISLLDAPNVTLVRALSTWDALTNATPSSGLDWRVAEQGSYAFWNESQYTYDLLGPDFSAAYYNLPENISLSPLYEVTLHYYLQYDFLGGPLYGEWFKFESYFLVYLNATGHIFFGITNGQASLMLA